MIGNEIIEAYNKLSSSEYLGVKGVHCFGQKDKGRTVGIGIMTHGNEPTGLAAYKYFLDNDIIPESGRVIFILNNLKAAEKYFNSINSSIEKKRSFRWVDINMNRLPIDCLEIEANQYEIERIKELVPVYETLDYGIDIHSAESDPKGTIINISDDLEHGLFKGFPKEMIDVIANMVNVQKGIPACWLFGGKEREIPILGIESGTHEDVESFETSIKCVIEFCKNCGVLKRESIVSPRKFNVYKVLTSVFYPKKDYFIPKKFLAFEELTRNQVLGVNMHSDPVLCPFDCLTLFGRKKLQQPKDISDEVFFLVDFPKTLEI